MIEKTGALSVTLQRLRDKARVSQKELARITATLGDDRRVSEATIRAIESESTQAKATTLRKLADGLAFDPFAGEVNQARSDAFYAELQQAAGYQTGATTTPASKPRSVEDLTDEEVREALARMMNDPRVSAEFLSVAEDWTELAPSAQRFILNSFELARKMNEDIKAAQGRDAGRSRRSGS